jgi:hypothetical protein
VEAYGDWRCSSSILTSAGGGEWSASRSCRFNQLGRRLAGPRAGLDTNKCINFISLARNRTPIHRFSSHNLIAITTEVTRLLEVQLDSKLLSGFPWPIFLKSERTK